MDDLEEEISYTAVARVSGRPPTFIEKVNGKHLWSGREAFKDFDFDKSALKQIEPGEQDAIADDQNLDDDSQISVTDEGLPDDATGKALNTEVLEVAPVAEMPRDDDSQVSVSDEDLPDDATGKSLNTEVLEVAPVAEMPRDKISVSQPILSIGIHNADVICHAHPRARARFQIPLIGYELPHVLLPTGQITLIPRPRDPEYTRAFEPGEMTSPFGVRFQLGGGYAQELIPQDALLPTERSLKVTVGPFRSISSVHLLLGNYHRVENNWLLCRINYEVQTKCFSSELLLSARIDCLGNVCISLMDYTTLKKYSWEVTNVFDINRAADPIVEEVEFFADMMNEELNKYADFDTFL